MENPMKQCIALCCLAFTLAAATTFAATLVEIRDNQGEIQRLWIEGSALRIDPAGGQGYMLFDEKSRNLLVIDHERGVVMDMTSLLAAKQNENRKAQFVAKALQKGSGPTIAGYSTIHFEVSVNDTKCSDEYLSQKALDDVRFFKPVAAMADIVGLTVNADSQKTANPCDSAPFILGNTYQKNGFPMKVATIDGSLDSEVLRIAGNVKLPPGGFPPPAGYPVLQVNQAMWDAMQNMPAMDLTTAPGGIGGAEVEEMMEEVFKKFDQLQ